MGYENRRLLFAGCGLLTVACLLYITANALPIWGTVTNNAGTWTIGFWGKCNSVAVGSTVAVGSLTASESLVVPAWECLSPLPLPLNSYIRMTIARVFVTISCILLSFSILSILSILLVQEDSKRILALLTKVLSIGSFIAGIVGLALGIAFVMNHNELGIKYKIGVSSILAIIAVIFNLGGAITTFIMR